MDKHQQKFKQSKGLTSRKVSRVSYGRTQQTVPGTSLLTRENKENFQLKTQRRRNELPEVVIEKVVPNNTKKITINATKEEPPLSDDLQDIQLDMQPDVFMNEIGLEGCMELYGVTGLDTFD